MKNQLNYSQLVFLSRNGANGLLTQYFNFPSLIDSFFYHLKDFFLSSQIQFEVLHPFWSTELTKEMQSSQIAINGRPLGELFILHHSVYDKSSLVYYSSTGLLEINVLNEFLFPEYTINDYLALIHELSSMLIGEKSFYEHLHGKNDMNE